jgi:orotidine-5'-phosphate decarboxylase
MIMTAQDRLILALDLDDASLAMTIVQELKGAVGMFKIGHQLFTSFGPDIVRRITATGSKVFLDLKYHDIPATVGKASAEAVKLGVSILNVHALGGMEMMKEAAAAVEQTAANLGISPPIILAVTVLTSMDEKSLRRELKIARSIPRTVCHLARMAQRAGLNGVVASPLEISVLRRALRDRFVILTPGVRPDWSVRDDQRRIMTPGQAVAAGADYIVVGRPVLREDDRRLAVERIVREVETAVTEGADRSTMGT